MRKSGTILEVSFNVLVTDEDIDDIMVSALEGGINYWCDVAKVDEDKRVADWGHEQIARGGCLKIHVEEPFDDDDTEWYELTKEKFLNGLKRYLQTPGVEIATLPSGNYMGLDTGQIDANGADEIIQFALFGEVVYA